MAQHLANRGHLTSVEPLVVRIAHQARPQVLKPSVSGPPEFCVTGLRQPLIRCPLGLTPDIESVGQGRHTCGCAGGERRQPLVLRAAGPANKEQPLLVSHVTDDPTDTVHLRPIGLGLSEPRLLIDQAI